MRLTAAKGVEADELGTEIDLAANKAMGPKRIDVEGATQQAHDASLGAAANEDHQTVGIRLKIRLPRGEERTPWGSCLDPRGGSCSVGADIALGPLVQGGERLVVEASPHLGLPATIEVFDGGLEPALLRRRKHRRDTQSEAGAHHAAEGIL